MKEQHTPGPYEASGNAIHRRMSAHYAAPIAVVDDPQRFGIAGTLAGNVALLTSAPELLEALEEIADMCQRLIDETDIIDPDWVVQTARAAIAKVRGETK